MFSQIVVMVLALAADSVEIPLKDIWALDMPGTQDIRKLEATATSKDEKNDADLPLISRIRGATAKPRGEPREAFAVLGSGIDALRRAASDMAGETKPQESFPAGSDVSLVFFSYTTGMYVYLDKVERRGNFFEIKYHFVPHLTKEMTDHFALIPLGAIESGVYSVDIVQSPMDMSRVSTAGKKPAATTDAKSAEKFVCRPFSFSVRMGK